MEPMTMMAIAAAAPAVANMLLPRTGGAPSGPDYSAAMAYMNSPELLAYRNSMLRSAYDPQSDIYQQASNQALAQSNRIAASRGLGTSGAGVGFAQNSQNDLAQKFQQGEFQRRLQAYQAAIGAANGTGNSMMNMANNQYSAQMDNYNRERDARGSLLTGIGSLANIGSAAYNYSRNQSAAADLAAKYGSRSFDQQVAPAGMVYSAPITGGNYNYGSYGGYGELGR